MPIKISWLKMVSAGPLSLPFDRKPPSNESPLGTMIKGPRRRSPIHINIASDNDIPLQPVPAALIDKARFQLRCGPVEQITGAFDGKENCLRHRDSLGTISVQEGRINSYSRLWRYPFAMLCVLYSFRGREAVTHADFGAKRKPVVYTTMTSE
jgi:hypothetical protein